VKYFKNTVFSTVRVNIYNKSNHCEMFNHERMNKMFFPYVIMAIISIIGMASPTDGYFAFFEC
jgi:hypothetical protein